MSIQELVIQCAIKVLREHAEGRSVDPDRLEWAVQVALQNPQRIRVKREVDADEVTA